MANLPRPATNADEYLYDIAMSLRQLQDGLAQLVTTMQMPEPEIVTGDDTVTLREPAPPKRKRG